MSADRDGLLSAIRAAPDDDVPRLVFADWLSEHGNEDDEARARFIRLQVEIERIRREGHEIGCPPAEDLRAREQEAALLLRQHKRAFLAGLPVGDGFAIYFSRGMPENAFPRDAKEFVKRAPGAFSAAMIRSLTFNDLTPNDVSDVLATGHVRGVESLLFVASGSHADFLPEVVARFGASPDVGMVCRLHLSASANRTIDVDGIVEGLISCGHWKALASLSLAMPGLLHAETMHALRRAETMPGFTELILHVGLSLEGPMALGACFPHLRNLQLGGAYLNNATAVTFARSKHLSHLRQLVARGDFAITDPDAFMGLLTSDGLASLTVLRLQGAPDGLTLTKAKMPTRFRDPTLRSLTLTRSSLKPEDAALLARLTSLRGLVLLDLSRNAVGSESVAALAGAGWERLRHLRLRGNKIGDAGAEALAASPGALVELDLSENKIGPDGVRALAASPYLGGLRLLNLDGNELTGKDLAPLKARLGRKGWSEASFTRPP